MSFPVDQFQPPPPPAVHPAHGSVGPVIGVLAVISILGVVAGVVGRLCFGRPVFGYAAHYDVDDWVQKKCASCLDGSLDPPPRPPHLRHPPSPPPPPLEAVTVAEQPETKQNGDAENLPPGSGGES